jgi:hypothetical protein
VSGLAHLRDIDPCAKKDSHFFLIFASSSSVVSARSSSDNIVSLPFLVPNQPTGDQADQSPAPRAADAGAEVLKLLASGLLESSDKRDNPTLSTDMLGIDGRAGRVGSPGSELNLPRGSGSAGSASKPVMVRCRWREGARESVEADRSRGRPVDGSRFGKGSLDNAVVGWVRPT